MNLFHEYQGNLIFNLTNYINTCIRSPEEALNEEELSELLNDGKTLIPKEVIASILNNTEEDENKLCALFSKATENGPMLLPVRNIPIPVFTTEAERVWLKNAISGDYANIFFSENSIVQKLKQRLENSIEEKIDFNDLIDAPTTLTDQFKRPMDRLLLACLDAFYKKVPLLISGTDHLGNRFENASILPYKLQYDLATTLFSLIGYDTVNDKIIYIHMEDIDKTPAQSKRKAELPLYEKARKKLEELRCEPIELKIRSDMNGFDRATYLFSGFDRSSYRNENGEIIMKIKYYRFQYTDMITKILFLGPAVTVLSPNDVVEKVVSELKLMYDSMNDTDAAE